MAARRVAVITGASSGIGRRTALDFAAMGWRVCAAARREDLLEELVAEMGGERRGHSHHVTDVSDRAAVRQLAAHVELAYGRCDLLVNNAGYSQRAPFAAPDAVEVLESIMATNFLGAVYCTKELLPLLRRSAPAHVVNVASVAGRLAIRGNASYSASKFALVGWSEALHGELAGDGIHVATVEPGPVPTEGFPQNALTSHPLGRYVTADVGDVSRAIQEVVARGLLQRTVPRIYHVLPVGRLLAPRMWRRLADVVTGARERRERTTRTDSDS